MQVDINYQGCLELTLEIEGLLTLMRDREDFAPAELEAMVRQKVSALAAAVGLCNVTGSDSEHESPDSVVVAVDAPEVKAEAEPILEPEPEAELESEHELTPESVAEPVPAAIEPCKPRQAMTVDQKLARESARDIRQALTLNDRFRFRRELFGNSETELSDALSVVSSMNSIAEAEDYFYNDLCWNADNVDVKAFMQLVANHFAC